MTSTKELSIPKKDYTAIAVATAAARVSQSVELDPHVILYLFKFYSIVKIRGANNPYARMMWPGI